MCKIIAIPSQPEKFFIVPLFLCVPAKRFLSLLEDSESHSRTGMLHYKNSILSKATPLSCSIHSFGTEVHASWRWMLHE